MTAAYIILVYYVQTANYFLVVFIIVQQVIAA